MGAESSSHKKEDPPKHRPPKRIKRNDEPRSLLHVPLCGWAHVSCPIAGKFFFSITHTHTHICALHSVFTLLVWPGENNNNNNKQTYKLNKDKGALSASHWLAARFQTSLTETTRRRVIVCVADVVFSLTTLTLFYMDGKLVEILNAACNNIQTQLSSWGGKIISREMKRKGFQTSASGIQLISTKTNDSFKSKFLTGRQSSNWEL